MVPLSVPVGHFMGLAGLFLILIINVRLEEGSIGCVCVGGGGGRGELGSCILGKRGLLANPMVSFHSGPPSGVPPTCLKHGKRVKGAVQVQKGGKI